MTNETQLALLKQALEALSETLTDFMLQHTERLGTLDKRLTKQEHWQSRLQGAWIVLGIVVGYLFGRV